MPRQTLTAKFVRAVKPAADRQEYLDTLVPQLMLRVSPSGHKSWSLLARYPGFRNPTRRSLGPVLLRDPPASSRPGEMIGDATCDPEIYQRHGAALTLAEAREKARRWLILIERKIDPANERLAAIAAEAEAEAEVAAAERARLSSFCAVAKEWLRRTEIKKVVEAERLLEREFFPCWEKRPIAAITPKDVAQAVRAIVDRHKDDGSTPTGRPRGTYQAIVAYGILRRVFTFAIGAGEYDITASPFAALSQKDVLGEKLSRDRVLDDDELRAVWTTALELGYPWGSCVRLLILTGQRLREIADLNWSEIDLGERLITISAKRMKSERAHEIPFGDEALALLQAVPRLDGGRGFVFSASGGKRPIAGFSRTKTRLDRLSGVANWVIHDLRRTFRTRLSALPIEDRCREQMIAHAAPGLHKVYDQHRYRDEKRRGFELWEGRLSQILTPERKVVALRGLP
jgi:integrase